MTTTAPLFRASHVRLILATGLLGLAIAACGGSAGAPDAPPASVDVPSSASEVPSAVESAAADVLEDVLDDQGGADVAGMVPAEAVRAILGEAPEPECQHTLTLDSDSCIWTAADGSTLKVQHGTEFDSADAFTEQVAKTGLEEPVDGLGEVAFEAVNAGGDKFRVATWDGGSQIWVVITRDGAAEAMRPLAIELAGQVLAAL